jgi:signal transduction histidine kinase
MRLLQKTNRTYVLFSSLLFLIAGALLYFVLTANIDHEANEQLLNTERRIAKQLERGQTPAAIPPVLEVTQLPTYQNEQLSVTDTAMYDNVEGEEETFRQVSSIRNINGQSYSIVLRQMVVEHAEYVVTIGGVLALIMGVLLICLTLINRSIYQTVWNPYYQTLDALKNFSLHQTSLLALPDTSIKEFKEMNAALHQLTEKARTDFMALKEFSENASHEMQTPLAVVQTKLDELLQDPALTEPQAKHIQTAGTAVQKLSKLNQTLLLLTKIENRQFIYTEQINIPELVQKIVVELEDFIQEKELDVTIQRLDDLGISANPALVDALLTNLLSNAIKHNVPKGFISITVKQKTLQVCNSGKPLTSSPAFLFERFSKADASSPSLGLGLAIVRTICHLYGWQVQYEVEQDRHRLEITFPKADV